MRIQGTEIRNIRATRWINMGKIMICEQGLTVSFVEIQFKNSYFIRVTINILKCCDLNKNTYCAL